MKLGEVNEYVPIGVTSEGFDLGPSTFHSSFLVVHDTISILVGSDKSSMTYVPFGFSIESSDGGAPESGAVFVGKSGSDAHFDLGGNRWVWLWRVGRCLSLMW